MDGLVLVLIAAVKNHCAYKAVRSEENIEAWDDQQKEALR